MNFTHLMHLAALSLLTSGLLSCATKSDMIDADGSVAAIEIENASEVEINQAVVETFLTNGYQRETAYGLTFIKKGDILRQVEYASYMGGAAQMRVKVHVQRLSSSSYLVKADAYTVTNKNSSILKSEGKQVRGIRKGHYRKLLREVKERVSRY